ncbi:ABC transporter ATPase [Sphingobacterium spiritivorum]|uniref:ABC transporter ATPase n=1 Tax=Sphingobacterium spiritivorum TaxID=258 RepID=A0A380BWY7_SPHSI|nr:ABC transporter ATPase [Sphingobacterium spiritivorum]SUJ07494.1 Uncharacterised protein [Sphingobacterium spiritivorum]
MRVWVYQASRKLTAGEQALAADKLAAFISVWNTHGKSLAADVEIRHGLFIILKVDENKVAASGCSIDSSVHFLKGLQQELGVDLFDRFQLAYRTAEDIAVVGRQEFEQLVTSGQINSSTIVFNNMISNEEELRNKWEVPFKDSWHARVFS